MKTSPSIFVIVTLGIIQFIGFFVYYWITPSPNLILHIIAISNLGLWVMLVMVLPQYLREDEELDIPPRIRDLIDKSWNEGLTGVEREELRLWVEEEDPGDMFYYQKEEGSR